MKIALMSVYNEVGTSFKLSHLVLKALEQKLRELFAAVEIPELSEKFRGQDFSLGFVISATRENDCLRVDGPKFMKKPKAADFVFLIPHKEISDVQARIDYVFNNLTDGIAQILDRYKVADPGVGKVIRNVATMVHENPKEYEYVPKHARRVS